MLTPEQLKSAVSNLIEELPEYSTSEDLMQAAVRYAVSPVTWIHATPEERVEMKREVYRALKQMADVKDIDNHLTREDLDFLKLALERLDQAISMFWQEDSPISTIEEAKEYIKKAMEK